MDILAVDVNSKEQDVDPHVAKGVDVPELSKATNSCLNIFLVLEEDWPMVETNPSFMEKVSSFQFSHHRPVRENEIDSLKSERASTYGRFSHHLIRERRPPSKKHGNWPPSTPYCIPRT